MPEDLPLAYVDPDSLVVIKVPDTCEWDDGPCDHAPDFLIQMEVLLPEPGGVAKFLCACHTPEVFRSQAKDTSDARIRFPSNPETG